MRRRLYFLLPDADMAETIENELLLARIAETHIHFMAKNEDQLVSKHLHAASVLQKSDLIHGWQVGFTVGGITGAALGTFVYNYPTLGEFFGQGVIMVCTLAGAFLGTWFAGLVAISIPNSELKAFEPALEKGKILLMIDVPKTRVAEVTALIVSHHPEAQNHGIDTHTPAFP